MNLPVAFASKARTLAALSAHSAFNIPALLILPVSEWREDTERWLDAIAASFPDLRVAARSSCAKEDSCQSSGAGEFLSILNLNSSDRPALAEAINRVIESYGEGAENDEVLIQEMIKEPAVTGVIMTRVLADGSPYYVINYDDESGKTDTITGGTGVNKTVHVYRGARPEDYDSTRLQSFVKLARGVEEVCASDSVDIEFCLDRENSLHLLQARPICAAWPSHPPHIDGYISRVAQFVATKTGRSPEYFGVRSILGVMPDWNPAEMIGIFPRPLAASLYRELITSRVWSSARQRMGYRRVAPAQLMFICGGRPYIDTRASFNSFLPPDLDSVTCDALVNAWLERLDANPHLHDKIEFEIAQTSMDFCFEENLDQRYPDLLTSARRSAFRQALINLTNKCLDLDRTGSLSQAMDAIIELKARHSSRPHASANGKSDLAQMNSLLSECRKYGTLPFSILARHAFIAEALLKTAVRRGALSPERLAEFKMSIPTISGEMARDFMRAFNEAGAYRGFLRKYGHLRPGSYDILSPRYLDRADLFSGAPQEIAPDIPDFAPSSEEIRQLDQLLRDSGLHADAHGLLAYARKAIAGREMAKFVFTRNVSDVLELIAAWGESLDFSREQVSWLDAQDILDLNYRARSRPHDEHFGELIDRAIREGEASRHLKLGYLIRSERDVYVAPQHRAAPNFTGRRAERAKIAYLAANTGCSEDIGGKLVCIDNADPGYDWIFTRGIAGLITRFGGANSHMAIRCAEYGLPAAIGVGEQLFEAIANSREAELDPLNAILRPL